MTPDPAAVGFALFETAIGACGIAWSERGIVALQLPEASEAATRARLQRRFPHASEASPPPAIRRATEGIVALFRGEEADLSGAPLDLESVGPFNRRVFEAVRTIPPGVTLSYGDVGALVGGRGLARAVGQALGRNPIAILVPCHRVLAARGRIGGFSAHGGLETKRRMLALEGTLADDLTLPLERG